MRHGYGAGDGVCNGYGMGMAMKMALVMPNVLELLGDP